MTRRPWLTLALVAACAALQAGGLAPVLEYRRDAGAPWRLVTGQLVHWGAAMALADLGVILAAGWYLEGRSRRTAAAVATAGALASAAVLARCVTEVTVYRGSSGIASALGVWAAAAVALDRGPRLLRWIAAEGVVVFVGKLGWEAVTGRAAPGTGLPEGIAPVPAVHLAGAFAGLLAGALARTFPRPTPPARNAGGTEDSDPGTSPRTRAMPRSDE